MILTMSEVTWKVHLFKRDPVKGIAVAVFVLALSIFSGIAADSALISMLAAIVLTGAVSQYFIPVTYHLDEENITVETPFQKKTRAWNDFKRWEKDRKSIKLLTMENPSRLDNYRAWLLITEKNTRLNAEKLIKEKLG